jgi:hypothetical protein
MKLVKRSNSDICRKTPGMKVLLYFFIAQFVFNLAVIIWMRLTRRHNAPESGDDDG